MNDHGFAEAGLDRPSIQPCSNDVCSPAKWMRTSGRTMSS